MKNVSFLFENVQFLEVKFSIYLNRRVFEMRVFTVRLKMVCILAYHYENTPIQIYIENFTAKTKHFQIKNL